MGKNKRNKSGPQSRATSPIPPAPKTALTPSNHTDDKPAITSEPLTSEPLTSEPLTADVPTPSQPDTVSSLDDQPSPSSSSTIAHQSSSKTPSSSSLPSDTPDDACEPAPSLLPSTPMNAEPAAASVQFTPSDNLVPTTSETTQSPHPATTVPSVTSVQTAESPTPVVSAQESVSSTLNQVDAQTDGLTSTPRASLDFPRSSPSEHTSEGLTTNGDDASPRRTIEGEKEEEDQVEALERTLNKTRSERDALEKQYRGLVAKVGTMRDTLGKKLREDAEELDRREAQLTALSSSNASLTETVTTLESELASQASETTTLSTQLTQLRAQSTSMTTEQLALERDLREARSEVERMRSEREEWREEAERERVRGEELEADMRDLEADIRKANEAIDRERDVAKKEKERGENLQSVLEEFQEAKDQELKSAIEELEIHLRNSLTSLGEWKLRAVTAESRIEDLRKNAGKSEGLEKELKEKNLLIGKLRHEAIITTEHLTEALRRLRRSSSSENVDRRLVTNILLSFLSAPRADAKRFEMLSLLGGILGWGDAERELAGLQRAGTGGGAAVGKGSPMQRRTSGIGLKDEEETAASESFSQLFVEFLLKEATSGKAPSTSSTPTPTSLSPSPSTLSLATPTGSQPALFSPLRRSGSFQHGPPSPTKSASGLLSPTGGVEESSGRARVGSSSGWGLAEAFGRGGGNR